MSFSITGTFLVIIVQPIQLLWDKNNAFIINSDVQESAHACSDSSYSMVQDAFCLLLLATYIII